METVAHWEEGIGGKVGDEMNPRGTCKKAYGVKKVRGGKGSQGKSKGQDCRQQKR